MRYTLIQIVQRVLEAMDSDEVNDVADTPEALAVANICKAEYFKIISEVTPKRTEGLFQLDASTDSAKPTEMFLPSNVINVQSIKYNIGNTVVDSTFRELQYLSVIEFLEMVNGLDENQTWVGNQPIDMGSGTFQFKYRNDVMPYHWTSPDDHTIILDSYDASIEDTLTSVRTLCYGDIVPDFQIVNTFIPKLSPQHFQLLIDKTTARAFIELKQTENALATKDARRGMLLAKKTRDETDNRPEIYKHRGFGRWFNQPDRKRGVFR